MTSSSTLTSTLRITSGKSAGHMAVRRAAPAKEVPKVAFESLTATEAAWHVVVLIAFLTIYLLAVVMVRFSLLARILTLLAVIGAAALAYVVLAAVTKTHRSSALRSLRFAIASGDATRIRDAIWRAQAAGVSAEDVATTQELRAAVSVKLQSAHADGNVDKLSTAVRCAKAAEMLRDIGHGQKQRRHVVTSPVERSLHTTGKLGEGKVTADVARVAASCAPHSPKHLSMMQPSVGSTTVLRSSHRPRGSEDPTRPMQEVGMTAEEVAFAERVLCFPGQEAEQFQSPATSRACWRRGEEHSLALPEVVGGATVQPSICPTEEALRELHHAVEAGEAAQLRAALCRARAVHVSVEEVTLAEAVLQIEEARLQRAALHSLRQAMLCVSSVGADGSMCIAPAVGDVENLRRALQRAQGAGVSVEELHAAEALLLTTEMRLRQASWSRGTLRLAGMAPTGRSHRGNAGSMKKMNLADDLFRINEVGSFPSERL